MNPKTTLFLLIALALVGVGFFVLYPKGEVTSQDDEQGTQKSLFSRDEFDPEGLRNVTVTWSDGREILIDRDLDGNWTQSKPVRFPLHRTKMELGVSITAATLMYTDRFTVGDEDMPSLEKAGLDKPDVVITFKGVYHRLDPGKSEPVESTPYEQKIAIGKTTIGGRGYVQLNGKPDVFVVNGDLHSVLTRDPVQEWRIKKLNGPSEAQAKKVTMNVEGERFAIQKGAGGEWALIGSNSGRINPYAIKALVGALNGVVVGRFEEDSPENMALFGLDDPRVEFTVETPQLSIKKRTLRIGGPADANNFSYFATWSQEGAENRVVFTVRSGDRAKFMPTLNEIRDPRISLFRSADVRKVKLQRGNHPSIELEKTSESGWAFTKKYSPGYRPDDASVTRLVGALTVTLARQYATKASREGDPLAIIDLNAGPTKDERLLVFPVPKDVKVVGDAKMYMVLRDDEETGYLIKEEELAPLFEPTIKLRDREVLSLDPKKMRRIIIKRSDGVEYAFQAVVRPGDKAPTDWALVGFDQYEGKAMGLLLRSLKIFQCKEWLAEPATMGPQSVEVVVMFKDMSPVKLTVDSKTGEAGIVGLEQGFVVPDHFRTLVQSEFRYRSVLPVSPQNVKTVTVESINAKPVVIARDDVGRFNAIGANGRPLPGIKLNYDVAAQLFDALSPLRVERYINSLDIDVKKAMLTITVKTKTLKTHTVYLGFNENTKVGIIGDQWFELSDDTASKLFSDSTKATPKSN